MTTGFGALSVDITADATSFTAALKNAEGQLASSQAKMNRALASVEKGFKAVAGGLKNVLGPVFSLKAAFATLLGAGGIGLLAKNALDAADAIVDMADRVGISTDALQEMMYVASQSGLSVEALETGLRKLNSTIADQAAGKKTVLGQLGIEAKDAAGNVRPLTEVLLDLADAFQKAGPQSAAGIRILTQAFGERAGTAFAGALKDGAAGVRQLIDDARRLGLVLENDLLRGAASANDALDRMKMIVGTNLTRLLLQLAPSIERVAQAFADAAPEIESVVNAIVRLTAGVEALSARGLAAEVRSATVEFERQKKAVEDLEKTIPGIQDSFARRLGNSTFGQLPGGKPAPNQAQADAIAELEKLRAAADKAAERVAYLQKLLTEQQEREGAAARLPAGGAVPSGMQERAPADKMREYLDGLRESAVLSQAEAKEREILEAILRAEAIARDQAANGQRRSAELSQAERESITAYVQLRQQATEAEKEANKAKDEGKQLFEATRTPAEIYATTLERINQRLAQNAISEDTANRARVEAKESFEKADEGAQQAKAASDQLAISFKSAFEEAVAGGGKIDDIFEALIQDIIKMIVQLYILKPLLNAIAKQFEILLSNGFNPGGAYAMPSSSGGNFGFDGGAGGSWLNFSHGGSFQVGGSGGTDSQLVAFRASPNEHVSVTTPGQAAGMGGGGVTVNVINKTDGKTRTEERQGDNGERMIEVIVEKALRRPGSGVNKALSDTYGAKLQLSKRG